MRKFKYLDRILPYLSIVLLITLIRFYSSAFLPAFLLTISLYIWRGYDWRIPGTLAGLILSVLCIAYFGGQVSWMEEFFTLTAYLLVLAFASSLRKKARVIKQLIVKQSILAEKTRKIGISSSEWARGVTWGDYMPFILLVACMAYAIFLRWDFIAFLLALGIFAWRRYDSRYFVGTAMFLLVISAAFLAKGNEDGANQAAIWAYYFLAVGVIGLLIKYVRKRRERSE